MKHRKSINAPFKKSTKDIPGPDDDDPVYGRPPEVRALDTPTRRYEQPVYPGLTVDPRPIQKEIAWLRDMVAQHSDKKWAGGPFRITQNLRKALYWFRAENREPLVPWVQEIMRQKRDGEWDDHHQTPFAVNQEGLLYDGLKRVIAGILLDEPEYEDYLWFGVAAKTFRSVDTPKPRNAPEMLKMKGISYHAVLSATVKLRHRIENKPGTLMSQASVIRRAEEVQNLAVIKRGIPLAYALRKANGVTLSSALLAYWIISEADHARNELLINAFWEHMVKETHWTTISPVRRVCEKLQYTSGRKLRADGSRAVISHQYLNQVEQVAWIIMAWNLWNNDLPVPSRSWPEWKGLPVLDGRGRLKRVVDANGELVMQKDPKTGKDTNKPQTVPNENPAHSLPPVGAKDAWGRGDPISLQRSQERQSTFAKRRQRTPGNVYRAQQ